MNSKALPRVELLLYSVIWVSCSGYAFYTVLIYSLNFQNLNPYDFRDGWSLIGRKQDISCFEWSAWHEWIKQTWQYYTCHVIISTIIRWKCPMFQQWFYIFFGLFVLTTVLGTKLAGLILLHCIISNVASMTHMRTIIWLVNLGFLSILNIGQTSDILRKFCGDLITQDTKFQWLVSVYTMTNLKCISFGLDRHTTSMLEEKAKTDKGKENIKVSNEKYNFIALLTYTLYLPMMNSGPLLTYDRFYDEVSKPPRKWTKLKVVNVLKLAGRLIFWYLFIEVLLHFMYFSAIHFSEERLRTMSLWTLSGIAYSQGQFFMLIYVVMYGLVHLLAKIDDIDTYTGPICISRVYKYSDMWKYFDRGLYEFLKRHIYIPCGGSRHGLLRRYFGTLLNFSFIFIFHGIQEHIFIWTAMNFIVLSIEFTMSALSRTMFVESMKKRMSEQMLRRVASLMYIPLLAMSVLAIFSYLSGSKVFFLISDRLLSEGAPVSLIIAGIAMYSLIQICVTIELSEKSKDKQL
ncbi:protein-cysteine N-palmitoyltransferase HHAT-like [Tubulanus polymorphus]|uniref:protein-cysteine N-palmitoyltransferase HHAT-like n=1 Tax=Tubulanus polymorphus TaxID=672921 RepID=UPI003DA67738